MDKGQKGASIIQLHIHEYIDLLKMRFRAYVYIDKQIHNLTLALSMGSTRIKSSCSARWRSFREELFKSAIAIFINSASDGALNFSINSLISICLLSNSSADSFTNSAAFSLNLSGSEFPIAHCSML